MVEALSDWLREPLAKLPGEERAAPQISLLHQPSVADGPVKLLVSGASGRPCAVVLCSAPVSPDMVERAMQRARQAKRMLDASAGDRILDPLQEGRVQGLSYAVLPYCDRLSEHRPIWWMQRALLRPGVFGWLQRVVECTSCAVAPDERECDFTAPLHRLASLELAHPGLRSAAEKAARRLETGQWIPMHVLMHGDMWKGNILIRRDEPGAPRARWRDRFVVIDWPGAEIRGYAIYDLVRLAQSMNISAGRLREEVGRHCRSLACEVQDAMSHLLSALGHVAGSLEHFPPRSFAEMAESCWRALDHALEKG